ncbi:hypothetical protein [Pararhodobacter sp. SW119]|uniref:hypothetical protein n=1 Tax=Pararhodobacter sp. SW119 TaxID=2780075 RepID=UPI001ADFBAA7|nr:hypothetical protein [Pararhodobacter sp. SW119]
MRALLLASTLMIGVAGTAAAGPWPRPVGSGFAAVSVGVEDLATRRVSFGEVYGEYGLDPRVVAGMKLRRAGGNLRADVFARWHPDLAGSIALGLTLGARFDRAGARRIAPVVALHAGRGAQTGLGNLWARADLQLVANRNGPRGLGEIEVSGQFGLRTERGALAMLSMAGHRDRDGTTLKLIPALGYAVGARSLLVLDATLLPRSRRVDGLRLAIWRDF